MTTINIQAITEMGCCVYASIKVSEDYTMNEVVREIKRLGYKQFRLVDTMKRFVQVEAQSFHHQIKEKGRKDLRNGTQEIQRGLLQWRNWLRMDRLP